MTSLWKLLAVVVLSCVWTSTVASPVAFPSPMEGRPTINFFAEQPGSPSNFHLREIRVSEGALDSSYLLHGGSQTSRPDMRFLHRGEHDGSHTSRLSRHHNTGIEDNGRRNCRNRQCNVDLTFDQEDGTVDLLGRLQRQRSVSAVEEYGSRRERRDRPDVGHRRRGRVARENFGQEVNLQADMATTNQARMNPSMYGDHPFSHGHYGEGQPSTGIDHSLASYGENMHSASPDPTLNLLSSMDRTNRGASSYFTSPGHDQRIPSETDPFTHGELFQEPQPGQSYIPLLVAGDKYEYKLRVPSVLQLANNLGKVYSLLDENQKLLIMDRVRQIRPLGSESIRKRLRERLTGPLAISMLCNDQKQVDDAVDGLFHIYEMTRGADYVPWMDGLSYDDRREVIELLAEATQQPSDVLREYFVRAKIGPEVARAILDLPNNEMRRRYAEERGFILNNTDRQMPWKVGLSHLQRSALLQRMTSMREVSLTKEQCWDFLGRQYIPIGWGKMMLKARPASFLNAIVALLQQ
ncbi:hypothetical protein CBS101457_000114 [Exobasidium rhododendri]|nr:hypothetical protein CBS101457_000114 [Exobasidium rhododendri]